MIQQENNFGVKGRNMGRVLVNWDKRVGIFKLGTGFEFYNTRYEYIDKYREDNRTGNSVGLYFHSGGHANILALSISAKYDIYSNRYYKLNAKLSPKIGFVMNSYYFKHIDDSTTMSRDEGKSFFMDYKSKWRYNGIFPLLAFEMENELKLSKRTALIFTIGYQQGFKTYMDDPMMHYRNYKRPNEKREYFNVQNKGNMLFYHFSYRHYF